MTFIDIIQSYKAGSILSIVVVILSLIEITPVKISPLGWLGKRLNGGVTKCIEDMEVKLDNHIAQSYRDKILQFQNNLLKQGCNSFTQEEYDEVLEAINFYEQFCRDNKIQNAKCRLAIDYIQRCYIACQNNASFANLPTLPR